MDGKEHNQQQQDERTPIRDADTRPDQVINPDEEAINKEKEKQRVTHERGRDVNTLEDFKDGK